jgi:hypothetical protein
MAYAVLVPEQVAAKNIDTLNANFVSAGAVENGQLLVKGALSADADKSEVFAVAQPTTGNLIGVWMAFNPEDVVITVGSNSYKVGDLDPRNFILPIGVVGSMFKPQIGDKILISADGFSGAKGVSDVYGNATNLQDNLVWGTTQTADVLSFKLLATKYISIAGGFGSQRVTAYQLECVNN